MTRPTNTIVHPLIRRSLSGRCAVAGAAAGLTLLLAACGTATTPASGPTSTGSTGPSAAAPASSQSAASFNDADVMFAQMMIPHHQQAVQMSDLVLVKPGLNSQVRTLAEQIKAAQAPEIATMTGWLEQWGAPTAADMGGMGHGDDGMLSATELQQLGDAETVQAQKLYVQGMIGHHRGAVTMAQTEIDRGSDPRAIALARDIVRTQNAEIDSMNRLLPNL